MDLVSMERRGYTRFPVEFPISFSGEDIAGEGTVIDLSKNGLKLTVTSEQRARPGSYLGLYLSLPNHQGPMRVESAAVRWTEGRFFGLELLYVEPEGLDRLARFMRTLETGPTH